MVRGQSFGSSVVSPACITSMCSVQCFLGGHSLRLSFGSFFYPLFFPLINQCDRCLVSLAMTKVLFHVTCFVKDKQTLKMKDTLHKFDIFHHRSICVFFST